MALSSASSSASVLHGPPLCALRRATEKQGRVNYQWQNQMPVAYRWQTSGKVSGKTSGKIKKYVFSYVFGHYTALAKNKNIFI